MRLPASILAILATSCSDASLTASVTNAPPEARIVDPGDGRAYAEGQPVVVLAEYGDRETSVEDLGHTWYVDGVAVAAGDAATGTGATLHLESGLEPGEHRVAIVVVDGDGASTEADVAFTVTDDAPPAVAVEAPSDGATFEAGQAVDVTARLADDGGVDTLSLAWTAGGAAVAGCPEDAEDEVVTCVASELPEGEIELCVTATDDLGQAGTACVAVTILPCEARTWYADDDGDGLGDASDSVQACEQPDGYVADASDCDDGSGSTGDATIEVPADFGTIQEAIDAACPGATIEVSPGTYVENLDLGGRRLHLVGIDGAAATIVDGGANGAPVLTADSADGAEIEGLTLRNGYSTTAGGVHADSVAGLVLRDVIVEDCQATGLPAGGGLYVAGGSTVELTGCTIARNAVPGGGYYRGGGIYSSATVSITDCVLSENTTGGGGYLLGGAAYSTGTLTIDDSVLSDNSTGGGGYWMGGAVYSTGTLRITGSTLSDNSTGSGGYWMGGAIYSTGSVVLTDSSLVSNAAGSDNSAGAAYLEGGTLESVSTDWGSDASDNAPNDVALYGGATYGSFGSGATFVCRGSSGTCE